MEAGRVRERERVAEEERPVAQLALQAIEGEERLGERVRAPPA
jgi:hypothetical protein